MHNIRNGAIRWQIPDFISDGIVMFALSLIVCKIFSKIIKCQVFILKMKIKVKGVYERDLRHLTGNVRSHTSDYFRILATQQHRFMQKGHTHTHTHTHTARDGMKTIGNICKADLPKNNTA